MLSEAEFFAALEVAKAKEGLERDAAFLPLQSFDLCGLKVRPLTIRDILTLDLAECVFVKGGTPDHEDIRQFLKWMTVDKKLVGSSWIDRKGFQSVCSEILEFIDDQMGEGLAGAGGRQPQVSWAASTVFIIACETGWSEEAILTMPMARVNQYLRCIAMKHDPDAVFFNKVDKLKADWLRDRAAAAKEAK